MSQTGPWGAGGPGGAPYPTWQRQARPGWQSLGAAGGPWAPPSGPPATYVSPAAYPTAAPYAAQTSPRQTRRPAWRSPFYWLGVFVGIFVVIMPLVGALVSAQNQPLPTRPARPSPVTASPIERVAGPTGTSATSAPYTGTPDLSPDQPPMPETDREARAALTANPLYAQSLAPTACAISAIDLVGATKAETAAHLNQFVSCLMAAWRPPVMTAGFELPHPSVTVYTGEINSPCGVLPTANAVYCTADQQIYYSSDLIESFPRSLTDVRFFSESVIAHEFGHTVQYRTEILIGEAVEENAAITEDDQQDLSRRLELQADCFAGLFLSAVAQSTALSPADEQNIVDVFASLGGTVPYSDDHGTGTNRAYWATQGLGSTNVGACSTFTAPDDQVS